MIIILLICVVVRFYLCSILLDDLLSVVLLLFLVHRSCSSAGVVFFHSLGELLVDGGLEGVDRVPELGEGLLLGFYRTGRGGGCLGEGEGEGGVGFGGVVGCDGGWV